MVEQAKVTTLTMTYERAEMMGSGNRLSSLQEQDGFLMVAQEYA